MQMQCLSQLAAQSIIHPIPNRSGAAEQPCQPVTLIPRILLASLHTMYPTDIVDRTQLNSTQCCLAFYLCL